MGLKVLDLYQVYKTAATVEFGIQTSTSLLFETTGLKLKLLQNKCKNYNKSTILHEYIKLCFIEDNDYYFYKTPDDVIEGMFDLELLENQFYVYGIEIDFLVIRWDKEANCPITLPITVMRWYKKNRSKFKLLAEKICLDIFFVLFSNRNLLSEFNRMISEDFKNIKFAKHALTKKGTIKRVNMPNWVKEAVFFRDRGHCVNCNKSLTGIININDKKNYDHIVPLDLYGINDPTNIQLLCFECNNYKSNRNTESGKSYENWFN